MPGTQENKQDLKFKAFTIRKGQFLLNFLILLSFISSKLTIYISLYYSEFSCSSYHKVAIFIAEPKRFLIGLTQTSKKYIFPFPNHWSPGSRISDSLVSSFLVMPSSLLPWLLVSSYLIQLTFTMRLPLPPGLPSVMERTFIRFWFECLQNQLSSWETVGGLSSWNTANPESQCLISPISLQSFSPPVAKTQHDSSSKVPAHISLQWFQIF